MSDSAKETIGKPLSLVWLRRDLRLYDHAAFGAAVKAGYPVPPYFRIFNPVLLGKRFDPEGKYVHKFVPELAHLKGDAIHEPWKSAKSPDYSEPIVDHVAMRVKAIVLFKKVSEA